MILVAAPADDINLHKQCRDRAASKGNCMKKDHVKNQQLAKATAFKKKDHVKNQPLAKATAFKKKDHVKNQQLAKATAF